VIVPRALLIGAAGFLGRHVHEIVADAGWQVQPASRAGRVRVDLGPDGAAGLALLLKECRPHAVINCAGAVAGDPAELIAANATGPAVLVRAMLRHAPRARLVHLGSAAEYGVCPPDVPITEAQLPRPVGVYGVSKLAGTQAVELGRAAGLDAVVLRVFNPVGPGSPPSSLPGRLVAEFVDAGPHGEIKLGSLAAVRDFVDARDVADAVLTAITAAAVPAAVLNVAGGQGVPVRTLVDTLAGIAGFTGTITESANGSARSGDVPWQQADIAAIDRVLGWRPRTGLRASLAELWRAAG
jgi:nucleoside-diphosphate-sugar epimerase